MSEQKWRPVIRPGRSEDEIVIEIAVPSLQQVDISPRRVRAVLVLVEIPAEFVVEIKAIWSRTSWQVPRPSSPFLSNRSSILYPVDEPFYFDIDRRLRGGRRKGSNWVKCGANWGSRKMGMGEDKLGKSRYSLKSAETDHRMLTDSMG